jgi:hypothetical protein
MDEDPQPSRRPRLIWPVIGVIATVARTLIDAWRIFHES